MRSRFVTTTTILVPIVLAQHICYQKPRQLVCRGLWSRKTDPRDALLPTAFDEVLFALQRIDAFDLANMSRLMAALWLTLAMTSALLLPAVSAQTFQNVTSLMGTWSSGSQNVTTGLEFFNPITQQFTLPATTGISYSFTDDGYFEESRYQFTSNAVTNRCFKASLIWQHGTYAVHSNGSLTLNPFPADGYVQVLDPCGAQTSSIYHYAEFELISSWYSYQDNHPGFMPTGAAAYALQLQQFDGSKMPLMWLRNRPPNMLPTRQLFQKVLNDAGA